MHYGSTLVTRAGSKVAERTNKVGKLTGSSTLGCHLTYKAAILLGNLVLDSLF